MATPLYGQKTVSGSAQQLASATPQLLAAVAWIIKAPSSNSLPVYLGDANVTTSTGFVLAPGEELDYECVVQSGQPKYELRPSDFYVVGTANDKVTWLASP